MSSEQGLDEARLGALFAALTDHGVDYALFGAVALAVHGLQRATTDVDIFLRPTPENVERLKSALRAAYDDPDIDQITAEDLCGDYAVVRYAPSDSFALDLVTRLGDAFAMDDLEVEEVELFGNAVKVVSARTLWLMKKDTLRYKDRIDAAALAERFSFEES